MIKGNKIYAILNPGPGYYFIRPAIFLERKVNKNYCNAYVEHENYTVNFEQCKFALTLERAKQIVKNDLLEYKQKELDEIRHNEFKKINRQDLKENAWDSVEAYYQARKK